MDKLQTSSIRGTAYERDWTQGSIIHNLWSLSWPMIITTSLMMIGPTIDMIWVGKLGSDYIAGVGVAGMIVQMVNAMLMGLFTSLRAMISRSIGAGDEQSAIHAVRQAFIIAITFSIVMAIIGFFLAEQILALTGVEADVINHGGVYLRISFIGMIVMSIRMLSDATMQASGDANTPMKITLFYRLFHVALCPFLVFGLWIFPRLGVSGAALTQVISQSLGTALGLWVLLTGRSRLKLNFKNFHLDFGLMWRLIKIGIPASIMSIQSSLSQLVLLRFISSFGTVAVAAHSLNQRVEMFFFMPPWGLGMAAGVLAGQNLGAQRPERAEKTGWLAAGMVESFMVICSVALLLWAESVVHLFSSDPEVITTGATFLRIATAGYLVMGAVVSFQQCISGVGDTLPPMLLSLILSWGIQIPLAYFLPRITDLGVYGVRWGIVAGVVVGAIAYTLYFRMGRWKYKVV
jgi:putative MATE family efflux protein